MKVKFGSHIASPLGTTMTAAPATSVLLTTLVTNYLLLLFCVNGQYAVVSGEKRQVFWVYPVPVPQSSPSPFLELAYPNSGIAAHHELSQYNSVSGENEATFKNTIYGTVPPHVQEQHHHQSVVYQGEEYVPVITPMIMHYGSAIPSGRRVGKKWAQMPYYYNSKSQWHPHLGSSSILGDDDDDDDDLDAVETVLLNQNVLEMPKRIVIKTNADEDYEDDGSGSTEIAAAGSPSYSNPLDVILHHDDNLNGAASSSILLPSPTATAVILGDNGSDISSRHKCGMKNNYASRFHPETNSCYTVGTQGPCGENMVYMATDSLSGHCECDQDSFNRPLVLIGKKCHFLYTQAICPAGYWLTSTTFNTEPACQPNPCYPSFEKHHFTKKGKSFTKLVPSSATVANSWVLFKGECVQLNSSSRHCRRDDQVVLFPEGSTQPACGLPKSKRRIHRRQISNVNNFQCMPGMKRHRITKKCIRSRAFVFAKIRGT